MGLANLSECLKIQPVICPYKDKANHPFAGGHDYSNINFRLL